jgi:hypothetical protein
LATLARRFVVMTIPAPKKAEGAQSATVTVPFSRVCVYP